MMSHPNSYRCAVMGNPIAHSKSPTIHTMFAQERHLTLSYDKILVPLEDFSAQVMGFFQTGGHGLNITIPFKQMAFSLPNLQVSVRAQRAQAINTLWHTEGQLHGCNTDGIGLLRDLHRLNIVTQAQSILIIGAGGATRGIIEPLAQEGGCQSITIVNRTPEKAHGLAQEFSLLGLKAPIRSCEFKDLSPHFDLIINASASGMEQTELPISTEVLARANAAYDLFYQAKPTSFIEQAKRAGVPYCMDGLGMLVEQAAESFYIWTNCRPDTTAVHTALRSQL